MTDLTRPVYKSLAADLRAILEKYDERRASASSLHADVTSRRYGDPDRSGRYSGIGGLAAFEHLARELGFFVYDARNARNQPVRYIALDSPPAEPAPTAPSEGYALRFLGGAYAGAFVSRFSPGYTYAVRDIRVFKTRRGAEKAATGRDVSYLPLATVDLSDPSDPNAPGKPGERRPVVRG